MSRITQIVVDCANAPRLARFWAAALDGYEVRPYDDEEIARLATMGRTPDTDPVVLVDGPGPELCFQEVPERKPGKNRVHFELQPSDRPAEVERLVSIGATVLERFDGHDVLADPEGNEFCVIDPRG